MSKIESAIDELYRRPLGEFVQARAALAKTLAGADAQRVKRLPKPTVVPWAVNQVYWQARPVFDRLMKSGERVRAAQIAALKGRTADVRAATDAHRKAIAEAVHEATRLVEANGAHPSPEALMRTFEALSVATEPAEQPGRLTQPLQPAGFEALTGITPKHIPEEPKGRSLHDAARGAASHHVGDGLSPGQAVPKPGSERSKVPSLRETQNARAAEARRERAAAARAAAEARELRATIKKAEAAVQSAAAGEARARAAWERAKRDMAAAQAALGKTTAARAKTVEPS